MERVTNNRFLIGFSCGNLFVMTPAIAFRVNEFFEINLNLIIEIFIYILDVPNVWSLFHIDP